MSVEQRKPMGLAHMTVVPENFGHVDEAEAEADEDDERMDVPSDPRVPRHR